MKNFFGVIRLRSIIVPAVMLVLSTAFAMPVLDVIKADAHAEIYKKRTAEPSFF